MSTFSEPLVDFIHAVTRLLRERHLEELQICQEGIPPYWTESELGAGFDEGEIPGRFLDALLDWDSRAWGHFINHVNFLQETAQIELADAVALRRAYEEYKPKPKEEPKTLRQLKDEKFLASQMGHGTLFAD